MTYDLILKILLGVIIFSAFLFIYAFYQLNQLKAYKRVKESFGKGSKVLLKMHRFLVKVPLLKIYLQRVERKLKFIELSDEKTIKKKATQLFLYAFGISSVILAILLYSMDSLYFLLLGLTMLMIINQQFLNFYIGGMEKKLLIQFETFLSEVKHHYHNHQMIDEAVYDTTKDVNKSNFEMSLHAKAMYDILSSEAPEHAMENYYDIAPNKFFKNFIALAHLVQKFGDKVVNEQSVFLTNMNYLKQEIKYELLRKERLNYLFKSLSFITIAPIFFIKPLEQWALMNLPELGIYFNGKYGFFIDIGTFLLVILSYLLISKMKTHENLEISQETQIYDKLLKIKWLKKPIELKINKNYSQYLKDESFLKDAGYTKDVRVYYLTKILSATSLFILCILVMINAISIGKRQLLISDKDYLKNSDAKYLMALKDAGLNDEEVMTYIEREEDLSQNVLKAESQRLLNKINAYNAIYFKWWYLLLAIITSIIAYQLPMLLLYFKKQMRLMTLEEEVIQMHTIILMLMYFERVSVEEVLKWMEQFSLIFRRSINKCLNDFEQGDIKALEMLKKEEGYTSFVRIVDNLINASEKIPLALAFDELVIERKYYQEKRKQDNEALIEKKGMIGKLIAFVPLSFTILFYLLVPFLLFSINQLLNYSSQMKGVL